MMRAKGPPPRVALVFDDELERRRFTEHLGPEARVHQALDGEELVKLAGSGVLDAAIAGVLHRDDYFLPAALQQLTRIAPEVAIVGVFDASQTSLDEAVALSRDIPAMGFVRRPGSRLDYLARRRPLAGPSATFTRPLLECLDRLPLFGAAHRFALLQVLHPSCASSIPEQANELGVSRRNLERWFQGPDLCTAACFQSVCGAGEAAYLRLSLELPERVIAAVVGILTRDGVENPQGVPRTIRNALGSGLDELRSGGTHALIQAVETALRTSRDPESRPVQWEPDARYVPERGVIPVPEEDRLVLMDAGRETRYPLDGFGMDAWPLLARRMPFVDLVAELAGVRRESTAEVRGRLIGWLGDLLSNRLIRRERGDLKAANGD